MHKVQTATLATILVTTTAITTQVGTTRGNDATMVVGTGASPEVATLAALLRQGKHFRSEQA